jgi:hypothetical protein
MKKENIHHLSNVHASRRDLHVVTKLEISKKRKGMNGADPAIDLK